MDIFFIEEENTVEIVFDITELSIYNTRTISKEITAYLESKDSIFVILNFNKIDYIDSSGIGFLLKLFDKKVSNINDISIINVSTDVKDIFMTSSLDKFFNIK